MENYTRLWVRESALTPIWVHFHGLPLYLFEGEALLSVANSIGTPLKIDSHNVNLVKLGTASVCVELDVSKPLMNETWVSFVDDEDPTIVVDGFWQKVVYDDVLPYCSKCFHMGHKVDDCKRDFEKEQRKGPQATNVHRRRQYRRVVNLAKAAPLKWVVNDVKKKGVLDPVLVGHVASSSGLENVGEEEKAIAEDANGKSMAIDVTVGLDLQSVDHLQDKLDGSVATGKDSIVGSLVVVDKLQEKSGGGELQVSAEGLQLEMGELLDDIPPHCTSLGKVTAVGDHSEAAVNIVKASKSSIYDD
ncbi:hypothetical protein LIER_21346 [Lithospermum erythrorhizon]|uniref:DUF4283 domain-containing protein n=1 Tax=Lithospermum erythrorhizon TaxID=34254 RepID=A0AAV3QSY7_LITER